MILSINGSSINLSSLDDVLSSNKGKLHDLKSSAPILFISTLARLSVFSSWVRLSAIFYPTESRRIEQQGGYMFTNMAVPSTFNFGQ